MRTLIFIILILLLIGALPTWPYSNGGVIFAGGLSSQSRNRLAIKGPMPFSSVSDLPLLRRSQAYSGQRKALRAAFL